MKMFLENEKRGREEGRENALEICSSVVEHSEKARGQYPVLNREGARLVRSTRNDTCVLLTYLWLSPGGGSEGRGSRNFLSIVHYQFQF